jgi:signal peptidase II
LAIAIALADQISKILIRRFLLPGDSVQVLGDFINLRSFTIRRGIRNQIGQYHFLFRHIICRGRGNIIYMIKTHSSNKIVTTVLAMVVGGAIGNFIDRIAYGQVVDFIDIDIPDIKTAAFFFFKEFELNRWYIFNIADIALTVGLVGFIFYLLLKGDKMKKPAANPPSSSPT